MTVKKNGVIMILDKRKVKNANKMFYLKAKICAPEGQVAHTNLTEEKKDENYKK